MSHDRTELKYWYDLYLIHKDALAFARKMVIELGGQDPDIEAIQKGDTYPYSSNIKGKIKFILKKFNGQRFSSKEIGDKLRVYEPDMNQTSVNQFCSILGKANDIGIESKGNKNKYYIDQK